MISTVLLIGIVILMAAVIGPWALKLATQVSEEARQDAEMDLICRQTAYIFDSDYGNSGVAWNFSGTNGTVSAKIINTGSKNL
jgi:FlaG/FlaF family flagellin (archaellin)